MDDDFLLDISPEEIIEASQILSDVLLQNISEVQQLTYVSDYNYAEVNDITQVINLDLIASATAGITDPLGQLRDWFISTFNSVASWIASSITGFINEKVIPAISGIGNWLVKVIPEIGTSLAGIPAFIADKIITPLKAVGEFFTVTLPSLLKPVTDFFTKTLPTLFSPAIDFFTKTLPSLFGVATDFFTKTLPSLFPIVTDFFTKTLPSLFSTAIDFFTKTLPSLFGTVINFFTRTLPPLFLTVVDFFTRTLPSLFPIATDFFTKTLPSLFRPITDFFTKTLPSLFTPLIDFFTKTLPSLFAPLTIFFTETLPKLFTPITDFFSKTIPTWIDQIRKGVVDFIDFLINLPAKAPEIVKDIANSIYKDLIDPMYSGIKEKIIDPIAKTLEDIGKAIWEALPENIRNVITALTNFFTKDLITFFTKILPDFIGTIRKEAEEFAKDPLKWIKEKIVNPTVEAFKVVGEWVWGALPPFVKDALTAITNFFTKDLINFFTKTLPDFFDSIKKGIDEFLKDPLGWIDKNIVKPIADAFKAIGEWIWNALPPFIKDAFTAIYNFFTKDLIDFFTVTLPNFIDSVRKGIEEFLKDPLKWIKEKIIDPVADAFKAIGEWIWGALPEDIKNAFIAISNFFSKDLIDFFTKTLPEGFKTLIEKIKEFFANPVEWLQKNVLPAFSVSLTHSPPVVRFPVTGVSPERAYPVLPIIEPLTNPIEWFEKTFEPVLKSGIVESLWNLIKGAIDWLINTLKGVINWLWEGIIALGKTIINVISAGVKGVIDFCSNLAKTIAEIIYAPVGDLFNAFFSIIESGMKVIYDRIMKGEGKGAWVELSVLFSLLVSSQFTFRMMSQALMWIGENTEFKLLPNVAVKIFSAGVEKTIEIPLKFGAVLKHLASEFREYPDTLMRGFMYGVSIWYSRPIARLFNYLLRNMIPIELPPISGIIEYTRRMLPLEEKFNKVLEESKSFMGLYGYSDRVIEQYLSKAEELSLSVKDRFGVNRKIPLSLLYRLPSPSDVATMMVRDIFPSIEEFQKIYLATGMEKDIGALYYFLRFRYPPPERLWNFTVRGISGLLWVSLTDEEKKDIEKEIKPLKAIMPISPIDLNFNFNALLSAFKTYMKWHDYFRGSWIPNFTSDNLIYIDSLADIPTKIDQRWMVKWGVYEHLSTKGVSMKSTIKDFATKILENTPASAIQMDLSNFSRTLLATGMHPDWVPTTAIAEAMNVLTEERTALRTGFMGLFKEGFYDINALEVMLSGFITSSFKVAYFDTLKMQWTTGWVNIPVMFLPPERKLLELKALMDRCLDILREIQRDVSIAYQEFIIWDYNEYKSKLTQVIESINQFYASDYKAITGKELPDELKLKFVEEYYKPYISALRIWRDVFTIRRIRAWTMRWLGWVMYRVAYGTVEKEDIENLISYMSKEAKLTVQEADFIKNVMELMYGISKRTMISDYLPTPSTMATLSEYITLPVELVEEVLKKREIPEVWINIWLQYIKVKPIKADAKSLLSTYIRAYRNMVITKDIVDSYIKELPAYGFTPKEIEFIMRSVDLEEQILEARASRGEYIPTPLTLATISEYLPEARIFFDKVVKAKKIPEEWIPLWARYIDVKPLVDDVKRYVSRAEDLYVRFMTKKEDFQKVLEEANKWLGYTPKEIEFIMKVTEFERYRNAWTELIGSVERLVSLSEYSPKASKYALGKLYQMIDALPLTDAEKQELKSMWEEYIRNRPVKSEARTYITQLINLFVDGLISDIDFEKELNAMKQWGFSDDEIMFYKAQANLRKARKLRIPVVYAE